MALAVYRSPGQSRIQFTSIFQTKNDSFRTITPHMLNEIFSWCTLKEMLNARIACKHWIVHTQVAVAKKLCQETQKQLYRIFLQAFVLEIQSKPKATYDKTKISETIHKFKAEKENLKKSKQEIDNPPQLSESSFYKNLFEYYFIIIQWAKDLDENCNLDSIGNELEDSTKNYMKLLTTSSNDSELDFLKTIIQINELKKKTIGALNSGSSLPEACEEITRFYGKTLNEHLVGIVKNITILDEQYKRLDTLNTEETPELETICKIILTIQLKPSFIQMHNPPSPIQKNGTILLSSIASGSQYNVGFALPKGTQQLIHGSLSVSLIDSDDNPVKWGITKTPAHLKIEAHTVDFPNLKLRSDLVGEGFRVKFTIVKKDGTELNLETEPFSIIGDEEKGYVQELDELTPEEIEAIDKQQK